MKTTLLSVILSALTLTACGTDTTPSASATAETAADGSIQTGDFKVYEKAGTQPSLTCDVHTKLSLRNGFAGPIATLENAVLGACKINVLPMQRTFNLKEVAGNCGSRHYVGDGIDIVDNRTRSCEDKVSAALVVKEMTTSVAELLVTKTFYSFDNLK